MSFDKVGSPGFDILIDGLPGMARKKKSCHRIWAMPEVMLRYGSKKTPRIVV